MNGLYDMWQTPIEQYRSILCIGLDVYCSFKTAYKAVYFS